MRIQNNVIVDDEGRQLILRGVNLGGSSKCPFGPPGAEQHPEYLQNRENISFVGRPFPLEDAADHFKRLRNAGMTFLRFVVTWEALEHEGPGIYDEAYLAFLRKILIAAEAEGISVLIDPHQDVWSRWSGGDGAPAWTMEILGIDLDLTDASGAAVTRQRYAQYHPGTDSAFPKMVWPSNYNRYAAATMFSLFFAGKTYAPNTKIEDENVQDYLQNHFIAAFKHAKRRLKNCQAIQGWGIFNEPHFGFIGQQNLQNVEDALIPFGPKPSPWQSICAASGYPQKVPVYKTFGKRVSSYEIFNKDGVSLFKKGFSCPWKQAGVWTDTNGKPELLAPSHFSLYNGKHPVFTDDFLKPFIVKYINAMNESDDQSIFFIEGLPKSVEEASHPSWHADDPQNTVNAFHWYDGFALFTKSFRSWFTVDPETGKLIFGKKRTAAFFKKALAKGFFWTKRKMGNMPSLLGEFGLAFDLNKRKAFTSGDYRVHEEALSMYYDAVDANLLHSTLWNYTADNTNKYGDGWNDEDLSIFSEGKERAVAGWKRPYPMATAGKPLSVNWNRKLFTFRFVADNEIKFPTLIYLPPEIFGSSPQVETNLRWQYEGNTLTVFNDNYQGEIEIKVRPERIYVK